jgi:hypothetical protein
VDDCHSGACKRRAAGAKRRLARATKLKGILRLANVRSASADAFPPPH